jgi:hypothetical protein
VNRRLLIGLVVLVLAALLACALVGLGSRSQRRPCEAYESWDACEAAPHCSPAHLTVAVDHEGPIWECAAKPPE